MNYFFHIHCQSRSAAPFFYLQKANMIVSEDLRDWRLWTPIISGYVLSALCPMKKNEGKELPQRPPAYVFGIVWPILYMLVGYSWMKSKNDSKTDVMHGVLTFFLCLWIVSFSCAKNKTNGLYILSCVIAITVCLMCLHQDRSLKIVLTPLLAWTNLAMHFNYHILD